MRARLVAARCGGRLPAGLNAGIIGSWNVPACVVSRLIGPASD
jgi:hypothetical protein